MPDREVKPPRPRLLSFPGLDNKQWYYCREWHSEASLRNYQGKGSTNASSVVNQLCHRLFWKTWFFSFFPTAQLKVDWQVLVHLPPCTKMFLFIKFTCARTEIFAFRKGTLLNNLTTCLSPTLCSLVLWYWIGWYSQQHFCHFFWKFLSTPVETFYKFWNATVKLCFDLSGYPI